jgi:hypothetical protein
VRQVIAILLVILGAVWLTGRMAAAQPVPRTSKESLKLASAAFQRGEYKKVVDTLTPELYPRMLLRSDEDQKEAHYLLGVSHYYLARRDLARQEFIALLYVDENYTMEPAVESPEVYAFFEGLKSELASILEERRKKKQREEELRRLPQLERLVERTIHDVSPWGNFVPFGYGQFRNGEPGWGVFFLTTQTITAATSISLFTWQAVTYGIPSRYAPGTDLDRIRRFQTIQVVTGMAFFGSYIWSVIDAFRNQPKRVTTTESVRPYKPPPPPPSASLLEITPIASPGAVGLGATWRF